MKFAKSFYGCKAGDIYPTQFQVGDECPEELVDIAKKLGVLDVGKKSTSSSAEKTVKPDTVNSFSDVVAEDKES